MAEFDRHAGEYKKAARSESGLVWSGGLVLLRAQMGVAGRIHDLDGDAPGNLRLSSMRDAGEAIDPPGKSRA